MAASTAPSARFAGNPMATREDLAASARFLLDSLAPFTSKGGARVRLGTTGTHYDEVAAELEGFSRPLWMLVPLIKGGLADQLQGEGVARWVRGLVNGTNPESEEYWGTCQDHDQRMVEMCAIGFALSYCPDTFYHPLEEWQKRNIAAWLGSLNAREMPDTNWRWFRVLANLGLRTVGAPEYSAVRLDADLDFMQSFWLERGWSADGPKKPLSVYNATEGGDAATTTSTTTTTLRGELVTAAPEGYMQCDYYSTSFALQLVPLVYAKLNDTEDPERARLFKQRAQTFARDMIPYFDSEGRAIPFGRSMTYRFAQAGFWAAAVFAGLELPAPLTPGVVKGLLFRNLRWWSNQPIFNEGGILSIGYGYSNNLFLTEDYNSPGSPYWACLAYVFLALPADDPFWAAAEEPLPQSSLPTQVVLPHIGHTMVRARRGRLEHTYLLSSGQSPHYAMRAGSSKYSKDAYSSAFGYSVPTGIWGLQQLGADSTLAVCLDAASDQWRVKRQSLDVEAGHASGRLKSSWRIANGVRCTTWLFPPSALGGGGGGSEEPHHRFWHIKVHKLELAAPDHDGEVGYEGTLLLNDAAFAIHANEANCDQRLLPLSPRALPECRMEGDGEALASSKAGVVGIVDLTHLLLQASSSGTAGEAKRKGSCVRGDASSNLHFTRSLFPSLQSQASLRRAQRGAAAGGGVDKVWLATAVFAIPSPRGDRPLEVEEWWADWSDRPEVPSEAVQWAKAV
ncbi:hypothetical protein ACQY0O_004050 [Thecaphora frezii]